ncbi:hypothetical protein LTR97_004804 [Elasticomyces elasticus]|uniref:Uncharacterized protein n=1 Tax=Elasticomyces elasticus TaxID=574655 RepID=A0AAN7VT11_9PEZI|nr:hypothetical protein LTR97_004804 [Elasticomyces elasticus]
MGIPYSKQINAAFDEVTPLVAAGFEVLQTTKNTALIAAAVQIYSGIILTLVLFVLIALLITVNPDLTKERDALVTPIVRWSAHLVWDLRYHWKKALIGRLTSRDFQGIAAESEKDQERKDPSKEVDADEG